MNLKSMIDAATSLAHTAAQVIPQAGLAEDGLKIVQNIFSTLESLKKVSPDVQSTAQLEAAHADLLKHVGEKGAALSSRLRGE
jgi:hypothetical protein